jgi:transposase, IS5 family
VDRLTGEVAAIARQSLRQVRATPAGRWPPARWRARLGRLVGELAETITATERLLAQTDQRLAGNRVIPDRLVSLADPDARPIRKGKPRAPTQFGYSLLLAEDERGFVADHRLQPGNPPDAPQLLPSVERVVAVTGRPPGTVVADRGFGTAANDQALAALGVKRIGLQRTGTPSRARLALERSRRFQRLRNWRVGIEARISHLKRSFGLRRTRLRRLGGAASGSAWGSSPTTCSAWPWSPDDPHAWRPIYQPAQQTHPYQDFFRSK